MDTRTHWEKIYTTKAPDQVSWYAPHLETSVALIERSVVDTSASTIDVDGGESTLVDDLLGRGFQKRDGLGCLAGSHRSHEEKAGSAGRSSALVNRRYW